MIIDGILALLLTSSLQLIPLILSPSSREEALSIASLSTLDMWMSMRARPCDDNFFMWCTRHHHETRLNEQLQDHWLARSQPLW